jgi:hypothetical protein
MFITTGVGMGRRRLRRAEPNNQASSVVKCSNTREESMREIDSSCLAPISRYPLYIDRREISILGESKSGVRKELTSLGGG